MRVEGGDPAIGILSFCKERSGFIGGGREGECRSDSCAEEEKNVGDPWDTHGYLEGRRMNFLARSSWSRLSGSFFEEMGKYRHYLIRIAKDYKKRLRGNQFTLMSRVVTRKTEHDQEDGSGWL